MSRWLDDPEASADAVIDRVLETHTLAGAVLAAYQYGFVPQRLASRGVPVTVWNRHLRAPHKTATPAPPAGPFDAAIVRLPKTRLEQQMVCHQVLGALKPGGEMLLYGGNDEGIRTAQKMLAVLLGATETIATHGHGRVVRVIRPDQIQGLKPSLSDWQSHVAIDLPSGRVEQTAYPGVFADGDLDDGTRLLLKALPPVAPRARVLDFGCGPGAIAREIAARTPDARVTLLDNDSLALEAARANVPGAETILADGVTALGARVFDMIVSNPPLHVGVKEDHRALDALVAAAPKHLSPEGALVMVVQRRIALDRQLAGGFGRTVVAADNGAYRVWLATQPKK